MSSPRLRLACLLSLSLAAPCISYTNDVDHCDAIDGAVEGLGVSLLQDSMRAPMMQNVASHAALTPAGNDNKERTSSGAIAQDSTPPAWIPAPVVASLDHNGAHVVLVDKIEDASAAHENYAEQPSTVETEGTEKANDKKDADTVTTAPEAAEVTTAAPASAASAEKTTAAPASAASTEETTAAPVVTITHAPFKKHVAVFGERVSTDLPSSAYLIIILAVFTTALVCAQMARANEKEEKLKRRLRDVESNSSKSNKSNKSEKSNEGAVAEFMEDVMDD